MKNINTLSASRFVLYLLAIFFTGLINLMNPVNLHAQIYEPEGLNMPGAWNTWTNPPANNLALASYTQVTGGRVVKINAGVPHWQTILKVAATGGDLAGGTYEWLFTSGPATNYYQNKWAGVTVIMDSLQPYTKEGSANNSITLVDGHWYTMNWEDLGYVNTRAIFMVTSGEPVQISTVSVPSGVIANQPASITVTLSAAPCIEEKVFVRYSTDGWVTSAFVSAAINGTSGTAIIPGLPEGTTVSYYALTTTRALLTTDIDLYTIHMNNNTGTNYSYTVGGLPPTITFANLQWPGSGMTAPGWPYVVYGQVYIPGITGQATPAPGLQAWVGYHTENTDPATWSNWVDAAFNAPAGNNDEFKADIGPFLLNPGTTYYYATRYKYQSDPYVYGGFSETGGGFWNGTTNINGMVGLEVGIAEKVKTGVELFPNPASAHVIIRMKEDAGMRINDLMGKTLMEKSLHQGDNTVDVRSLAPGVYIVTLVQGSGTVSCKLFRK